MLLVETKIRIQDFNLFVEDAGTMVFNVIGFQYFISSLDLKSNSWIHLIVGINGFV